jgi:hypothetical protein
VLVSVPTAGASGRAGAPAQTTGFATNATIGFCSGISVAKLYCEAPDHGNRFAQSDSGLVRAPNNAMGLKDK